MKDTGIQFQDTNREGSRCKDDDFDYNNEHSVMDFDKCGLCWKIKCNSRSTLTNQKRI